jgi:hypothetical protein
MVFSMKFTPVSAFYVDDHKVPIRKDRIFVVRKFVGQPKKKFKKNLE